MNTLAPTGEMPYENPPQNIGQVDCFMAFNADAAVSERVSSHAFEGYDSG